MRTTRLAIFTIVLLIFGSLAAACQSEPQAQATPAAPPAATAVAVSTSATAPASTPQQIPTASPGKSVIHGVILSADTKKPLSGEDGVDVFLAGIIYSTDKTQRMAGVDKGIDPRVDLDKDGVFVFTDVAPGEYAIAVRGPMSEVLVRKADSLDQDYIFTVAPGQTLDVGQLYAQVQ
jgi:hypothetical protein